MTIRYGATRTRPRTSGPFDFMIIRRIGRYEPSSRRGLSRVDGPGSSSRRRRSVVVVHGRILSVVIEPKAISSKPTSAKSSAAEPTAGEASIEATTMEAASAKTAFMAAAASERHSRLNQADCRKYEQRL